MARNLDHLIWELPEYEVQEFAPKQTKYCFITVVWNEGDRLRNQLGRMKKKAHLADIIVMDGRSTDGSTDPEFLKEMGVRTKLDTDARGLCTATRIALGYAIEQGYEGVITVDGNGKDGIEAVDEFIQALDEGYGLVQGSRYLAGGFHKNTPLERYLGTRLVMSPILSLGARHYFSDPTNAFRACSMEYLTDPGLQPLRKIFERFNLQLYLTYRAKRLGYKVKEIAVLRTYPDDGTVPTKIVSFWTKLLNVWEMVLVSVGHYNPKS